MAPLGDDGSLALEGENRTRFHSAGADSRGLGFDVSSEIRLTKCCDFQWRARATLDARKPDRFDHWLLDQKWPNQRLNVTLSPRVHSVDN
jgi:hypothetical protein